MDTIFSNLLLLQPHLCWLICHTHQLSQHTSFLTEVTARKPKCRSVVRSIRTKLLPKEHGKNTVESRIQIKSECYHNATTLVEEDTDVVMMVQKTSNCNKADEAPSFSYFQNISDLVVPSKPNLSVKKQRCERKGNSCAHVVGSFLQGCCMWSWTWIFVCEVIITKTNGTKSLGRQPEIWIKVNHLICGNKNQRCARLSDTASVDHHESYTSIGLW